MSESEAKKPKCLDIADSSCLLLEDHNRNKTLPTHLSILFTVNQTYLNDSFDILACLVYTICMESGFLPPSIVPPSKRSNQIVWGFNRALIERAANQPLSFRHPTDAYKFTLRLQNYPDEFRLVLLRSGDGLCITFSTPSLPGRSLYLTPSRFVPIFKRRNLATGLRHLKELSSLVRDQLAISLLNDVLKSGAQIFPALTGIPSGAFDRVLVFLSHRRDLRRLALTCWSCYHPVVGYMRRHAL